MWFITTMHNHPSFYRIDKTLAAHSDVKIDWKTEHTFVSGNEEIRIGSSSPFIVEAQSAISALRDVGVTGFINKAIAKEFTKLLPHGSFKYLRIIDKTFETERRRMAKGIRF